MIRGIVLVVVISAMPALVWAGNSDETRRVINEARSLSLFMERIYGIEPASDRTAPPPVVVVRPSLPFSAAIRKAAGIYRIPPPLIAAVIKCESDWNPSALSAKGAIGLMQVMPRTASETFGVGPAWLSTPETNIMVGTAYLRLLANRYRGNSLDVLGAYNAGPGRVDRRTTLPRETRDYRRCVGLWHRRYAGFMR